MTATTFNSTLEALQNRAPFRPFTVVMTSNTQFEVDHAKALIFRDGIAVFLSPGGAPVIFDHEGVERFVADLASQTSE